jgi:hypothetical protein
MRLQTSLLVASLTVASTARALPPGADPQLRAGANHHVGDDSFVAAFGRAPNARDRERVRMTTHLRHVHRWLASRPATRPELAARRAEILAYLDDYIAKGTTPKNVDLPWRTPVFIDKEGTICAVGYLIERSVGRELPERIAAHHRYDFIEDIADAMPEVREWIAASGLTLDEIASIQPAYSVPRTLEWRGWDLARYRPPDGPSTKYGSGNFKHGAMEGEWHVTESVGGEVVVVGRGTMHRGRGPWTSFYTTGEKLAEGAYDESQPEGRWRFWHKSGNLAAEGSFAAGTRVGTWRFYYDTPKRTPIAIGRFARSGEVTGRWRHFGTDGERVATSWRETPSVWGSSAEGAMLEVVPGPDGVAHAIHQGTSDPGGVGNAGDGYRLESFAKDGERLYVDHDHRFYGADGVLLTHDDDGWHGRDCRWSMARKAVAASGDLARLHGLLSLHAKRERGDGDARCTDAVEIAPERARRLDALVASRDSIRAITPKEIRALVLRQEEDADEDQWTAGDSELIAASDLVRVLANSMIEFVEWPHVDRRFDQVYATMAGRFTAHWEAAFHRELGDVRE